MPKVHTIDGYFQGVPQTIATYLVQGETGLALIETGPSTIIEKCVAGLAELGFQPSDIKHVLVTHIHLDHAGGAGWWAKQGAHVYVHHVGARHLIDPSRLWRSASRIYGDEMETLWGEMLPIPEVQLTALHDGDVIEVGDLRFEALDTPGHANHHMAYKLGNIAFTGDSAGAGFADHPNLVDLPAPPPEFHLETWLETLDRLRGYQFETIYPTHFGGVDDPAAHYDKVEALLRDLTGMIEAWMNEGVDRDAIMERFLQAYDDRLRAAGLRDAEIVQYKTATPPHMAVDGIMRYWRKKNEAAGT